MKLSITISESTARGGEKRTVDISEGMDSQVYVEITGTAKHKDLIDKIVSKINQEVNKVNNIQNEKCGHCKFWLDEVLCPKERKQDVKADWPACEEFKHISKKQRDK